MKILSTHKKINDELKENPFVTFPNDVFLSSEEGLLQSTFGGVGMAILNSIRRHVCQNKLYYFECSERAIMIVSKTCKFTIKQVKDCINECIDLFLFDKDMYGKHNILTSISMQDFFVIASRKRKSCKVEIDYWLTNPIDLTDDNFILVAEINPAAYSRPKAARVLPQPDNNNKVKYSKVKESKVKESNLSFNNNNKKEGGKSTIIKEKEMFIIPTITMISNSFAKIGLADGVSVESNVIQSEAKKLLNYYKDRNWKHKNGDTIKDWSVISKNWFNNINKNETQEIEIIPIENFESVNHFSSTNREIFGDGGIF